MAETFTRRDWPLLLVLFVYLLLGSMFAILIPPWQVPDEPAHYNYVRQLAQTGAYPVIAIGDYDQKLIETRIAPPNAQPVFSLDGVQYEDHQPPLFYTLALPVFLIFGGALIPLRLFSLFVGGFTILFGYLTIRAIFPAYPHLAAFAVTFVALLPQHLHMMAGFNNDSLSEALIALSLWLSARLILATRPHPLADSPAPALSPAPPLPRPSALLLLGIVVGLAFLTKVQAYLALPVAIFAVFITAWRVQPARSVLRSLLWVLIPAVIIGVPWWVHGLHVYGGTDFLGLQRHNLVVAGQPTTAEWIASHGWGGLLASMAQTTFQSFWGQFGWMSIVLDSRFYLLFLAVTVVSTLLFLAWWVHGLSAKRRLKGRMTTRSGASIYSPFLVLTEAQTSALALLGLLILGALAGFAWYNLQFVQHQGRYLYPALIPLAAALSLGWHFVVSRRQRLQQWLWLALLVAFIALDAHLLWRVILPAMAS